MNLGFVIILIVVFGYVSNWLNWKHLNYRVTRLLYYVGAFVHESSHALLCIATGARIYEFKVFSSEPHVTHSGSKVPLIGNALISFAPIAGGLFFLFLMNHYVLGNHFSVIPFTDNWNAVLSNSFNLLAQLHPLEWQSWVMIALFINIGAMIGPSAQDVKNVWPILIILFFIQSPFLINIGLIALMLILVNIMIQIAFIVCLKIFTLIKHMVVSM